MSQTKLLPDPVRVALHKILRACDAVTLDQLLAELDASGAWPDDFAPNALRRAKKTLVRRLVRTLTDDAGFPLMASLPSGGTAGRTYKQLHAFTEDDYASVHAYWVRQMVHAGFLAESYARKCEECFGHRPELA
jgi:hypothetical protein